MLPHPNTHHHITKGWRMRGLCVTVPFLPGTSCLAIKKKLQGILKRQHNLKKQQWQDCWIINQRTENSGQYGMGSNGYSRHQARVN